MCIEKQPDEKHRIMFWCTHPVCATLYLTALCWTLPWHSRHPLTMHSLVSALYCIAMPCRPPGLVGLVGTCGDQRCGDSAITTGESEELPPPRSPPCQSPRPPPSPPRINSMVWWQCNYKGSRSKVGARTAWHLKSSTGLDFPRASCFWCFPHIGPTLGVSDTQIDSIQYLNFAKKWFNSIFNSILFHKNLIQKII